MHRERAEKPPKRCRLKCHTKQHNIKLQFRVFVLVPFIERKHIVIVSPLKPFAKCEIYILFAILIVNIDFYQNRYALRNDVKVILLSRASNIYNIIKLKLKLISINFRLWGKKVNANERKKKKSLRSYFCSTYQLCGASGFDCALIFTTISSAFKKG